MRLCSLSARFSLFILALTAQACAPELEKFERRQPQRGSLGEEVYKAICRRIAGTELPTDVAGDKSEAVCLGDAAVVQGALVAERANPTPLLTPRLLALAERRAAIAQAVDDLFPVQGTADLGEDFEQLLRRLTPFYDGPEERVQNATRELAGVLERLLDPNAPGVLPGLARIGREGMAPLEASLGLIRATLGASNTRDMARSVLPVLMADPDVQPHFETVLNGLALELATSELSTDSQDDADRLKRLVIERRSADFSSGRPLFMPLRDPRGLPLPNRALNEPLPYPFVDANGDGLADADGGRLVTLPDFSGRLPEPFSVVRESGVARDGFDRALALAPGGAVDMSRPLYQTVDADITLLAGMLRAAKKVIGNPDLAKATSQVLSAIVGTHAPTAQQYGAQPFAYAAPDATKSPLLELVHGSTGLLDRPVVDASIDLTKRLLETQEATLVAALEPLLTLERRTRPGSDAYPTAELKPDHTLWDELLYEAEKLSRRRNDARGETLLEALVRGSLGFGRNLDKPGQPIEQIVDPELLRHQGVVLATLMRFKDEWRANPKGESKRSPEEPLVLGSFREPVDRTKPSTPVTCGKDGCGGLIVGSPFERWRQPNQQCQIQRAGRSPEGRDCGAPPNQSLLHRSMGLIAEMAGRSQCNKPISIGDLLDFAVLKDPCTGIDGAPRPDTPECEVQRRLQRADRANSVAEAERAVDQAYTCKGSGPCAAYADKYPAAFVDRDGVNMGQEAAIQACHMLDLPDVGRSFGDAVLNQFRLQFPNPWVRRYLEDVAMADGSLPACTPDPTEPGVADPFPNFPIVDPNVAPGCTPEAARLSRQVYENNPDDAARLRNVNTLSELVEFLLDDTTLFGTDPQAREELRPNVKSLSRVLFAPAGSTSFIIFDPLVIRGAPPQCSPATAGLPECSEDDTLPTPAGGCCIKDIKAPPLRYRLDTYYGSTSFAWEYSLKLTDGREISFLDTMKSISDAAARFDYKGVNPELFEDTGYVFSNMGRIVAEHWDSSDNPTVQGSDPNAPNYRKLTGIARYEPLLADALDDGFLDRTQLAPDGKPLLAPEQTFTKEQQLGVMYHSVPLLQAIDRLDFTSGLDGIDISAEVTEQLLSGHARCAGSAGDRRVIAGEGACDRALRGEPGFDQPFTYLSGRNHVCWNDGRCFDGVSLRPRHYAAPLYVMLDALGAMDRAVRPDPLRDRALRDVISGMLDAYAGTKDGRLTDRNVRALLIGLMDYTLERVGAERRDGTLATLAQRSDQEMADLLHNPVIAGALGVFERLHEKGTALADMSRYAASMLSETPEQNNLRPLLAGLFDLIQLLPGDAETNAALRVIGSAFASNVGAVVAAGGALAPQDSAVGRNLFMLRETARLDDGNVMERVLQNAARVPPGRPSPLDVILEALVEVNRVQPGAEVTPSADDLRAVLGRVAQVMRDERRGFERLYDLLRCSRKGAGEVGCD